MEIERSYADSALQVRTQHAAEQASVEPGRYTDRYSGCSSYIDSRSSSSTGAAECDLRGSPPRLLLQIHDELIFEIPLTSPAVDMQESASICHNSATSGDVSGSMLGTGAGSYHNDIDGGLDPLALFVRHVKDCMEGRVVRALKLGVPLVANVQVKMLILFFGFDCC